MNDEETLSDYVDNRLAREEHRAFEARLKADPALARRARLLRAMKSALAASAPPMPADLKAALKREARARAAAPSRLARLRAALTGGSWTYGIGAAAFAAAALALALRYAPPLRRDGAGPGGGASNRAAGWSDQDLARGLEGMWSDDSGGDNDEG